MQNGFCLSKYMHEIMCKMVSVRLFTGTIKTFYCHKTVLFVFVFLFSPSFSHHFFFFSFTTCNVVLWFAIPFDFHQQKFLLLAYKQQIKSRCLCQKNCAVNIQIIATNGRTLRFQLKWQTLKYILRIATWILFYIFAKPVYICWWW